MPCGRSVAQTGYQPVGSDIIILAAGIAREGTPTGNRAKASTAPDCAISPTGNVTRFSKEYGIVGVGIVNVGAQDGRADAYPGEPVLDVVAIGEDLASGLRRGGERHVGVIGVGDGAVRIVIESKMRRSGPD